jgi:hypothetical protein
MLNFVQDKAIESRCPRSIISAEEPELKVCVCHAFLPECIDIGLRRGEVSWLRSICDFEIVSCSLSWRLRELVLPWVDDVLGLIFAVDESTELKKPFRRAIHVLLFWVEAKLRSIFGDRCFDVCSTERLSHCEIELLALSRA